MITEVWYEDGKGSEEREEEDPEAKCSILLESESNQALLYLTALYATVHHWWSNFLRFSLTLFISRTWKVIWAVNISLSHSNKPLVVYWNTMNVIESVRF